MGHSLRLCRDRRVAHGRGGARAAREYLRVIWHELSRIHSHLLWLGLAADAFGFESMFMHCWRLRERVLDLFEKTTGRPGHPVRGEGGRRDARHRRESRWPRSSRVLDGITDEYTQIMNTLLTDTLGEEPHRGRGRASPHEGRGGAFHGGAVRPRLRRGLRRALFRARRLRRSGGRSSPSRPREGDCYARVKVRCAGGARSPSTSSRSSAAKIPARRTSAWRSRARRPTAPAATNVLEQPRGECYYYARGNGTKNLERMRMRTPTSQNLAGHDACAAGRATWPTCNMIILTIDPCISCTER